MQLYGVLHQKINHKKIWTTLWVSVQQYIPGVVSNLHGINYVPEVYGAGQKKNQYYYTEYLLGASTYSPLFPLFAIYSRVNNSITFLHAAKTAILFQPNPSNCCWLVSIRLQLTRCRLLTATKLTYHRQRGKSYLLVKMPQGSQGHLHPRSSPHSEQVFEVFFPPYFIFIYHHNQY